MEQLTLAQLFGVNAIQTSQTLTIRKSDLLLLTPSANNSAESLLTAILLTALANFKGVLTDEFNQPLTDEFNSPFIFDNSDQFEFLKIIEWKQFAIRRKNQPYINHQLIIFMYATV